MKRILILTLGALALIGNANAGSLAGAIEDLASGVKLSAAVQEARFAHEIQAERQDAYQAQVDQAARERADKFRLAAEWNRTHPLTHAAVVEGDQLPVLAQSYDDAASVRVYLHDAGYTDVSDAQVAKVIDYMKAHQIRHVSELGR